MPRLPTMQKRFISPNQQDYISPAVNNLAQSLQYLGQVANKIQDVQDTTNANKELSTFKLEATQKADELALQYGDNPKQYEKEFGKYIEESKGSLVDNSQVSVFNKNSFKNLVDNSVIDLEEIKFKNTRQLQASKVKNDIQATSDNLLNLSYKYGKDGDIEQLDNLQNIELSKLESGAKEVYTSGERQALMKSARQNNYTQFLTGQVVANPQEAINMIEAGVYNEKIDYATIDKIKGQAKDILKRIDDERKKGIDEAKIVLGNENKIRLDAKLGIMDVTKDGEIKNKKYQSIDSIIDFNNEVETVKPTLDDKEYVKYKTKVYEMVYNQKKKFESKGWFENNPTAIKQSEIYINNYMSPYDQYDKTQVYIDVLTQAKQKGIDLTSQTTESKKQMQAITKSVISSYYDIDPTSSNFETQLQEKVNRRNQKVAIDIVNKAAINIQSKFDPDKIME